MTIYVESVNFSVIDQLDECAVFQIMEISVFHSVINVIGLKSCEKLIRSHSREDYLTQ